MICWRIDLWQKLMAYLDRELPKQKVRQIENHLLDCGWCRNRLAKLRDGQRLAMQMPEFTLQNDPWSRIETAIIAEEFPQLERRKPHLNRMAFAMGLLAAGLVLFGTIFMYNRYPLFNFEKEVNVSLGTVDLQEFRAVNISEISQNTAPHIVAEGYVMEVRKDDDGDLTFKLVENINHPETFIFCEIINPIRLIPPPPGSRVRVYGVSRYDGEANHKWYEVHPVLNIEKVEQ